MTNARPGRLDLGRGLLLTFQRFVYPAGGSVHQPPASLGALPVGCNALGAWLLPLADDECFWIGMAENRQLAPAMLAVRAELGDAARVDAVTGQPWDAGHAGELALPGTAWLAGLRQPGSEPVWTVFSNSSLVPAAQRCISLTFRLRAPGDQGAGMATRLELVNYPRFFSETGIRPPAPMEADAAYKGWRLP